VTPERAIIYARESPSNAAAKAEAAGRETPFDTQIAECRAWCDAHAYPVVGVYRDTHTRSELWERDDLTRARERIRRHDCEVLVCHTMERLAVGDHYAALACEAEYHGVRIEFAVGDALDPNSPEGQMQRAIQSVAAVWERERIRERTQRGLRTRLKANRPIAGPRPRYGLRWVMVTAPDGQQIRDHFEEDATTGPIVRWLYARVLEGATVRRLVDELHAGGVRTATGREWWDTHTVRDVLHDPVYLGTVEALRYRAVKTPRRGQRPLNTHVLRPPEERQVLPDGTAPALVERATWQAVQAMLTRNKAEAGRNARWPDASPLRGRCVCGACGRTLYLAARVGTQGAGPDGRPLFDVRCRLGSGVLRGVNQDAPPAGVACMSTARLTGGLTGGLEAEVWAGLRDELRRPDVLAAAQREATALDERERADVAAVDHRLRQLRDQRALQERQLAALDPTTHGAAFTLLAARLEATVAELGRQDAAREERAQALAAAAARVGEWEALRAEWSALLDEWPAGRRIEVYRALDLRVTVWAADPARRPAGAPRWEARGTLPAAGLPVVAFAASPFAAGSGAAAAQEDVVGGTRAPSPHNSPHNAGLPLSWRGPVGSAA
jgi:DNA invertase Pin-like site-specific DNA recombinase